MEIIDGDSDSEVSARLMKHPTLIGRSVIQVRLKSNVKPALRSSSVIDPEKESDLHMLAMVRIIKLAEYQNGTFGDTHDPGECGKAAARAFKELMAKLAEQQSHRTLFE